MVSLFDTLEITLQNHNKTCSDIEWVGSEDVEIPLDNFINLAKETDDSNYKDIVPNDLIVVGNDFIVIRELADHDDDGVWLYINTQKPKHRKQFATLDSDKYEWTQDELKKAYHDERNKINEDDPRFLSEIPIGYNGKFYYVNYAKLWMLEYKKESSN